MGKLQKKSIIFICIAVLMGTGFILPIIPVLAYPPYPQTGIIGMWSGGSVPTGWEIVSEVNGRFVLGTGTGETPGATGGSSTHRHAYTQIPSHSHGTTSTRSVSHNHAYSGGGTIENIGSDGSDITTLNPDTQYGTSYITPSHGHTVGITGITTCYTEYSSNLPPYQTVTYIKKVSASALYPAGLIVISTSGARPSGWLLCDGTSGTPNLQGDFLMGSVTPGSTGGSATHNHIYTEVPRHNHGMSYNGGSHNHGAYIGTMQVLDDDLLTVAYDVPTVASGTTASLGYTHDHLCSYMGSSTCYTQTESILPTYVAVDFLMSTTNTEVLPIGVVALWDGVESTIPFGWSVSDGSGSVDLRNKFVRGRTSESYGATYGSSSHSHTYTTVPYHTHTISAATSTHYHSVNRVGGFAVGGSTLLGTKFNVYTDSSTRYTTSSTFSHSHYINTAGIVSPSTSSVSNYPPYVKFTYIQNDYYEADSPYLTSAPSDRSLEYGYYTGQSISWTATDTNPDYYTLDLMGSGRVAGPLSWISGSPITYNIPDGFGIGSYTYDMQIFDKFGKVNTDTVTLTVEDTTDPGIIDAPVPLTVEYGYTGQSFSWTATDFNPYNYHIERLDTGVVVGPTSWTSGSPVTYNIPNGLDTGTYTYQITFVDDYSNYDTDTVTFTVEDTTKPVITIIPDDVIVEYGTEFNVSWTGTDPYPNTYTVDQSNVGIVAGPLPWESGVEINYTVLEVLGVGTYTFTINLTDIDGNYQTDSMDVTIVDTTDPVIGTGPDDLTVELGYTDQSFSWSVTDSYPYEYTIELAGVGTIVDWTPWTSGTDIVYSIPNGFTEGVYVYTLNVTDEYGNDANHVVTLTVEPDTTDPVVTNAPDDITVELGYSDQSFSWIVTDLFPAHYKIELAGTGTVVDDTAWTSGGTITYAIPDGLSAGTYTYTITIYDAHGNMVTDEVLFTVEAPPPNRIPGYGVPIVLLVTTFSILPIVLITKKKLRKTT